MEIDGDLEMLRVAIATGTFLDRGDLGIQSLGNGVGNAMREIRQHIRQVTCDQLGGGDHRRQVAVRCPEEPSFFIVRLDRWLLKEMFVDKNAVFRFSDEDAD